MFFQFVQMIFPIQIDIFVHIQLTRAFFTVQSKRTTSFVIGKLPDWQKRIVSDYKKAFDTMQAGEKGAKEIGFSLTDPNKNKSKKDAFAERLKERVNLLKEAYSCLLYTSCKGH